MSYDSSVNTALNHNQICCVFLSNDNSLQMKFPLRRPLIVFPYPVQLLLGVHVHICENNSSAFARSSLSSTRQQLQTEFQKRDGQVKSNHSEVPLQGGFQNLDGSKCMLPIVMIHWLKGPREDL